MTQMQNPTVSLSRVDGSPRRGVHPMPATAAAAAPPVASVPASPRAKLGSVAPASKAGSHRGRATTPAARRERFLGKARAARDDVKKLNKASSEITSIFKGISEVAKEFNTSLAKLNDLTLQMALITSTLPELKADALKSAQDSLDALADSHWLQEVAQEVPVVSAAADVTSAAVVTASGSAAAAAGALGSAAAVGASGSAAAVGALGPAAAAGELGSAAAAGASGSASAAAAGALGSAEAAGASGSASARAMRVENNEQQPLKSSVIRSLSAAPPAELKESEAGDRDESNEEYSWHLDPTGAVVTKGAQKVYADDTYEEV
jgi:hypothetical protein